MEKKGVSPVVGTILLIAITVALAAIVAMLVSGLGGRGAPPSAMLTVTAKANAATGLTGYTLTVSHEGGDDLVLTDLEVQASKDNIGGMQPSLVLISGTTGAFTVGSKATVTIASFTDGAAATDCIGKAITVYIIHKPSKQKMFSSSTVVVTAPTA